MYWNIIKRSRKTQATIGKAVKSFKFNEDNSNEILNKAKLYVKKKNWLKFLKRYYYDVEFSEEIEE